jgi:hypothetical protein
MKLSRLLLPALAFLLTACSDAQHTTVTGTVLVDGKPSRRAGVQFWPKDELSLGTYLALTDAEGRFTMKGRLHPEVKPGTYFVFIGRDVKKDGRIPDENDDMTALMVPGMMHNMLPPRYFDRSNPLFTVEIKPGPNELPPFQLTSE